MEAFAKNTKHKSIEMETDADMEHIAKKFLVTQSPKFVNWKLVFPFVADDLSSINFRAPNVLENYANFKYVTPSFLDTLLVPVSEKFVNQNETLRHYVNTIQPPKGKELYAFFAHSQINKSLVDHVEYMVPDNPEEQNRLLKAIRNYKSPLKDHDNITNVGNLIQSIQTNLTNAEKTIIEPVEQLEKKREEEQEPIEEKSYVPHKPAASWNEEDSWRNSILRTFKTQNKLPTHYSSQKAIRMILFGDKSQMGKYQTDINLQAVPDKYEFLWYIDHVADDVILKITNSPEAMAFYRKLLDKPENSRELVKLMIKNNKLSDDFIKIL